MKNSITTRLASYIDARLKVLFVGPPGCAKTARVHAAAKAAGFRVIVFRASLADRVDLSGVFVPDTDAGVTRVLPLELLQDLKTTTVPTILLLDDLGQAPVEVQASIMLLFDRGLLSPAVLVWGATNRPGDKAGVSALCEPLRSRFDLSFAIATPGHEDRAGGPVTLGAWADEVANWCDWAAEAEADYRIIAWHRNTSGAHLYAWKPNADPAARCPDFRSWETVVRLFRAGLTDLDTVGAAIGRGPAAEFLAFAALANQLPTPAQVWADPAHAALPTEPAAQFLVSTMLGRKVEPANVGAFLTYVQRLPRHLTVFAARDAHKRLGNALSRSPDWTAWFIANADLFRTA